MRRQVEPYAPFGLLAVFALLWVPEVNGVFFDLVDTLLHGLGVSRFETSCGLDAYRFWQEWFGEQNPSCVITAY